MRAIAAYFFFVFGVLCLQSGCIPTPSDTTGTDQESADGDQNPQGHDNNGTDDSTNTTETTSTDSSNDSDVVNELLSEIEPLKPISEQEFQSVWPKITGTWKAIRFDTYSTSGVQSVTPNQTGQGITLVIDDSTYKMISTRNGESETDTKDIATFQKLVRNGWVVLKGGRLHVLQGLISGVSRTYVIYERQ